MEQWIKDELKAVEFGDKRLNARLGNVLDGFCSAPDKSIPAAFESWGDSKAAYRFFSNEKVNEEKILATHISATLERVKQEEIVLLLQDTTEIDYTRHPGVEDLGYIGVSAHAARQGFYLHPTIAVTPNKVNLGLVDNIIWKRDEMGTGAKRKLTQIEDKQSYNWLKSFRKTKEIAKSMPKTNFINIADRECDIYEYFLEYNPAIKNANFIVRSAQNRITKERNKLWEQVKESPSLATLEFELPRGRGRESRFVTQEVRSVEIELISPKRHSPKLANVNLYAVLATEINGPNKDIIEWLLLTTLPIDSAQKALTIVEYYLCRWQIELYFKTLKSGCKIEELQLESYAKLKACLAVYMIVAWRVQYITMISRIYPEQSCEVIFTKSEWLSVYMVVNKGATTNNPPTTKQMLRMVAQLGGFLGRKGDGDPGLKTIWIGLQKMKSYALAWEMFNLQTNTCG
jgi:hypothetical protein